MATPIQPEKDKFSVRDQGEWYDVLVGWVQHNDVWELFLPGLGTPTNITVTVINNTATVSWTDASINETQWGIEVSRAGDLLLYEDSYDHSSSTRREKGDAYSFDISGLQPREYTLRIRAENTDGNSIVGGDWSNYHGFEIIDFPPVTTAPVTTAPVTTEMTVDTTEPTMPPVTTAPVTTEPTMPPVTTAPVTTEPTMPPVTTAPVTTAPVTTAPVTTAPVTTAPVTTAPVTTAPVTTMPPVTTEPTMPPVTTEPTMPPVTTAPVTTEPTMPPVTTAPVTTGMFSASISVEPTQALRGSDTAVTVSWTVVNAESYSIDGPGLFLVDPITNSTDIDLGTLDDGTNTWTITATDAGGNEITDSTTCTVIAQVTGTFSVSETEVCEGGSVQLSWSVTNAISVTLWDGSQETSETPTTFTSPIGGASVVPYCRNKYLSDECMLVHTIPGSPHSNIWTSETLSVMVDPLPSGSVTVSPSSICAGSSAVVRWSSNNTTSVTDPIGGTSSNNSTGVTVSPTSSTNYVLTMFNACDMSGTRSDLRQT